jgi:hypothetical protein
MPAAASRSSRGLRPGIGSSSTKRMTYGRLFKFSAVKLGRTMSSIGFSWKVASDCSRPRLRGGGCGNCFCGEGDPSRRNADAPRHVDSIELHLQDKQEYRQLWTMAPMGFPVT